MCIRDRLRDLGAQVLELPAIRTKPVEPNPELTAALEQFGTSAESWLVFTLSLIHIWRKRTMWSITSRLGFPLC